MCLSAPNAVCVSAVLLVAQPGPGHAGVDHQHCRHQHELPSAAHTQELQVIQVAGEA